MPSYVHYTPETLTDNDHSKRVCSMHVVSLNSSNVRRGTL